MPCPPVCGQSDSWAGDTQGRITLYGLKGTAPASPMRVSGRFMCPRQGFQLGRDYKWLRCMSQGLRGGFFRQNAAAPNLSSALPIARAAHFASSGRNRR